MARCRWVRVPASVSEGREDPREWCGVPIGTLPSSGSIRGLQTLGYSCGVASPLCLRRVECACVVRLPLAGGVSACWWGYGVVWRGAGGCVSPLSCPRVARTLGDIVEYLSALSLRPCLSEGYKPSVTRVEWFHHSASGGWVCLAGCVCLWCGGVSACWWGYGVVWRGAGGCVSPPACPRVARTLVGCVEYLSALSFRPCLSEGCKPSVTLVEWLRHSASCVWRVLCEEASPLCLAGVTELCLPLACGVGACGAVACRRGVYLRVRGYVLGMSGEAAPQE